MCHARFPHPAPGTGGTWRCGKPECIFDKPASAPGGAPVVETAPPDWFAKAMTPLLIKERIERDAKQPCDSGDNCPPGHPEHGRCVPCKARSVIAGRCCATDQPCPTPAGCLESLSCQGPPGTTPTPGAAPPTCGRPCAAGDGYACRLPPGHDAGAQCDCGLFGAEPTTGRRG